MLEVYTALLVMALILGSFSVALGIFALYQKRKERIKHSS